MNFNFESTSSEVFVTPPKWLHLNFNQCPSNLNSLLRIPHTHVEVIFIPNKGTKLRLVVVNKKSILFLFNYCVISRY